MIDELRALNTALEQRVAAQKRDLLTLTEVSAVAGQYLDLETMLDQALKQTLAALQSEIGLIYLPDNDEGRDATELRLVVQQGISPELLPYLSRLPANKGAASWVLKHREPMLLPNLIAAPAWPDTGQPAASRACLIAPMRARGQVVGLFGLLREPKRSFSLAEVTLVASIADQVGLAVEGVWLHQLAERAAIVDERHRLAHDLHDSVTQLLYGLILFAKSGQKVSEGDLTRHYLNRIVETAEQAVEEMRLLVHQLSPPLLLQQGLIGALKQRLAVLEEQAGLKTHLAVQGPIDAPAPIEEALYYIAQEALNNALKHAAPGSIRVSLSGDGQQVELEVADDGRGYDPGALAGPAGLGLASMRERARQLGGSLQVISAPGKGTKVKACVGMRRLS